MGGYPARVDETDSRSAAAMWADAYSSVIDDAHLATGDRIAETVAAGVRPLGLSADVLLVDLAQRTLTSLAVDDGERHGMDGTVAGRCFQEGEILPVAEDGDRVLWVPMLDGTDRVGVLRIRLGAGVADSAALRRRLWSLAGLVAQVVITKFAYSDRLRRLQSGGPLSPASELLWQLLPPRTFATERIVVSALLEPHAEVAGDGFDYNVDGDVVDLAIFDAAGHDLRAGTTTALAITAIRNARRGGETDLRRIAAHADALIATQPRPLQFATAVISRFDTATGELRYLLAGHPPPLLVRAGRVVKELSAPPRSPLGIPLGDVSSDELVAREQLEPGDRLLFYSDGITEARDEHGRFFGEERLVEFTERAAVGKLSAPETLRRLGRAVLDHQDGRLQDDATLLLAEWSTAGHLQMVPTLHP